MRPINWDELESVCKWQGWSYSRMKGDHYIMTKPGMVRPVVFPKKKALGEDIVLNICRTIGIKKKDLEEFLNPISKSAKP